MTRQFDITWKASPNFRKGRNGKRIIGIVDHITAGLMPGCLSWMQNRASKASAHYLVSRTGRIYQMVKDEDTAYHAGEVRKPSWPLYDGSNPNNYTIGIEFEALAGQGITEEQYQAGLWLHRLLIQRWNIPIDRDHIIGHYRIDSVNRPNDPGPAFPWDRLFADLKGEIKEVPEWMKKIMVDAKEIGLITSDHDPNEPAKKWFVLAVALSAIKIIKGGK